MQATNRVYPNILPPPAQQANRRRLRVFLGTLTVALAVSVGFTWFRPAEYRASTRLEIIPAAGLAQSGSDASGASEPARPFLTEVQVLTSRPVLEQVATQLERAGYSLSSFGSDSVAGMQARLEATPVPNTNVVELVATGQNPELLAPLLNATVDAYRGQLAETYRASTSESAAQADEEVNKLEASVAARRREVENFRIRHNIVSLERDENQLLAQVRNLGASLSVANDRVAAADGKFRALKESAAAGKAVVRSRDDPTLANLEQRISQLREELGALERTFTPQYLAKEPRAISLRTRLAELERQIKVQREASQQAALVEAEEELAGAQAAAARIQSQITTGRQEVGQFTARFNEYKAQQDELADLEKAYRDAAQRRAKLEASERARMPTLNLLEAATTPQQPWRPLYLRDTALGVVGSLVLGLLAMGLVELFNRAEAQPAVVFVRPPAGGLPYESGPHRLPIPTTPAVSLESTAPPLLAQPTAFPRELREDEAITLLRTADDTCRLAMLLLFSGIRADEAIALRWSDIDGAGGLIHVTGSSARDVPLSEHLRAMLDRRLAVPASDLVVGQSGAPLTRESIDAQILCAAHDAGVERPTEVTSACLRHTYVAFLVRQGMRFADLTRLVGQLPTEILGAYSALAPAGARVAREAVNVVFPGDQRAPEQASS